MKGIELRGSGGQGLESDSSLSCMASPISISFMFFLSSTLYPLPSTLLFYSLYTLSPTPYTLLF